MSFVDLDLHVAGLHVHVSEPPLPQKGAPRIECRGNAVSIERLHRFLSILRCETVALRSQCAGPSNRRVMATREMQTLCRFLFHGCTEPIALNVSSEERAK
jgi:hypothetical protein